MDVSARFPQSFSLQVCPLVGCLQGPIVEPLVDHRPVVYLRATLRSGGKDKLSVWEGGLERLSLRDPGIEKRGAKGCRVRSSSVKDDERMLVSLERFYYERIGV